MSTERLMGLTNAAAAAVSAGDWQKAEHLWKQVREISPTNVQALFSLGVHAYRRGDFNEALELLSDAQLNAPRDPMIPLTISIVYRDSEDPDREWAAIVESLSIDPYFVPGLLGKGEYLERAKKTRAAAAVFRDLLKVAPHEAQWPSALKRRLAHARDVVRLDTEELVEYLRHKVAKECSHFPSSLSQRWDEAISIVSGRTKPYHSECNQLYVPRLPARTFYDPALFDWVPKLEENAVAIKIELENLLTSHIGDFVPYIAYQPGDPVNQWQALNHSHAWSSFHLWKSGEPVQENLARCPKTAASLAVIDAVKMEGLCPNAMFSVLAPRTVIPPHHGETNARLVAHLPLLIPERCSFRVGYDRKLWEEGKVLVFDDTIEHEARNDSEKIRVVLIFDVWNPLLSPSERGVARSMARGIREYRTTLDVAT